MVTILASIFIDNSIFDLNLRQRTNQDLKQDIRDQTQLRLPLSHTPLTKYDNCLPLLDLRAMLYFTFDDQKLLDSFHNLIKLMRLGSPN